MRRTQTLIALVLLLAVISAAVPASAADSLSDQRKKRDAARAQKAAVAAQVNVLKAQDAQVRAALATLNQNVASQEAELARAQTRFEAAQVHLAAAQAAEQRNLAELARTRRQLQRLATDAYVLGGTGGGRPLPPARTAAMAARRSLLAEVAAASATEAVDHLRQVRQDLATSRRQATTAEETAGQARAEAASRFASLTKARAQQASFAAQLSDRIESRLSEAAGLARLDAQLSADIIARESALARANPGGGSRSGRAPTGRVPLTNVRGIWVNSSIADNVERLLAAAESDGFVLGGGGYRDSADQQRLREANCPDPENSPPSDCSPPTARPGESMHEQGLAIDFTWSGRVITSRSNPAYQWLSRNAGRYGLYNLPSEPWHWSTNGN